MCVIEAGLYILIVIKGLDYKIAEYIGCEVGINHFLVNRLDNHVGTYFFQDRRVVFDRKGASIIISRYELQLNKVGIYPRESLFVIQQYR